VLVLGACVSPALGDAYCGPAERMGVDGCAARPCAGGETLDLVTGACASRATFRRGAGECPDASVGADRGGSVACLRVEDTCPHGTLRDGDRCARPPACPPGTLPEGAGCRAFVSAGVGSATAPRVDVGLWAARVLGVDGGAGSDDLCRPLARRADAFGLGPGEARRVALRISVTIPDQDTTRAVASAHARFEGAVAALPLAASDVIERALASLIEPFRGLGGDSSAAALEVTVRCNVTSP
jgi:hypothetical protein